MNETNGDDVDEETINNQLTVLNESYGGMENSMHKDCNGNPTTSYETGFRFKKAGETTRTYVTDLEDESFLETISEEELINLYFLLEQGPVLEDITSTSFETFLQNQTLEEQITTLDERPNAGLTYIPFLFGKKVRGSIANDDDDCTKLHIYIQPGQITPVFGYAQTPWNCRQMNELNFMDGIFIHLGTLPGSNFKHPNGHSFLGLVPAEEYLSWSNQGDTAVHEVGHWLGLTHTFAGATMNTTTGCDIYGGDEILDTPAQEDAGPLYCTERPCCNLEQDTCPHIPGTDPVWNFMDYSDDCCMSRFSSMQAEKMRFSWKLFRNDYMDTTSTATATATATTNNNGNDDINNNNSTFASLAIDFIADSSGDDDNTADVSGGSASATTTTTTVFTNNAGISMSDIVAVVAAISMIMSSFL